MTTTSSITIRRARPSDRPQLITLFADAFLHSPVGDWLIADLDTRYAVYCDYFAIFIDHGLAHGVIDTTDANTGAAIWHPHASPPPDDYTNRLADACGPWLPRFQQLDHTFARHHPTTPHEHLTFIAVHPDVQNYNIGTTLLRHRHSQLDQDGTAAYLEASNSNNRRLYLRSGYSEMPAGPFHLPDNGPPIWPMWRQPRPTDVSP